MVSQHISNTGHKQLKPIHKMVDNKLFIAVTDRLAAGPNNKPCRFGWTFHLDHSPAI